MTAARRALHPVTLALVLLVGCAGAVIAGTAATVPLLAVAAGFAAGFANSGST